MNHKVTDVRVELKKKTRNKIIRNITVGFVAVAAVTAIVVASEFFSAGSNQASVLKAESHEVEETQQFVVPETVTENNDVARDSFSVTAMTDAEKKEAALAYAQAKVGNDAEWQCLYQLWNKESGWRWNAENAESGAYGIPQAWPGNKLASMGDDWRTNWETQIDWGLWYIAHSSYGTPCAAWQHSVDLGWY